jgi:hypothetical protein
MSRSIADPEKVSEHFVYEVSAALAMVAIADIFNRNSRTGKKSVCKLSMQRLMTSKRDCKTHRTRPKLSKQL